MCYLKLFQALFLYVGYFEFIVCGVKVAKIEDRKSGKLGV